MKTKNTLIVEGKEDKALIEYLLLPENISIETIFIDIDVKPLKGLSEKAISQVLEEVITDKRAIHHKIGIIIDIDNDTEENRLNLVNQAIKAVFPNITEELIATSQFITTIDKNIQFDIACYFIGVEKNGVKTGELEDVLQAITIQSSDTANCIRECLQSKVSSKILKKEWLHFYLKYDICTENYREQAGKNCHINELKTVMNIAAQDNKKPFNFDSPLLNELRNFLKYFSTISP